MSDFKKNGSKWPALIREMLPLIGVLIGGLITFFTQEKLSKIAVDRDDVRQIALTVPALISEVDKCADSVLEGVFDPPGKDESEKLTFIRGLPGTCRVKVDQLSYSLMAFGAEEESRRLRSLITMLDALDGDIAKLSPNGLNDDARLKVFIGLAERVSDFAMACHTIVAAERSEVFEFLKRSKSK